MTVFQAFTRGSEVELIQSKTSLPVKGVILDAHLTDTGLDYLVSFYHTSGTECYALARVNAKMELTIVHQIPVTSDPLVRARARKVLHF